MKIRRKPRLSLFAWTPFVVFELLIAISCVSSMKSQITITPDAALESQMVTIASAINAEADGEIVRVAKGGIRVMVGGSDCGSFMRRTCFDPLTSQTIKISQDCLDRGDVNIVMVHEIGHAFGLVHSQENTSVMFRYLVWFTLAGAAHSLLHELVTHGAVLLPPNAP